MSSSLRHHERGAGWRGTQSAQSDCAHLRPLLDQSERNQTKSSCPEIAEELSISAGVIQPLQGAEDFAELADRGMGFAHSAVADRRLGRGSIQVAPNTFVRRSKISSAMK